ncbi:hypothetical protein PC116_g34881 [Phytophthora cactorum]|nr:hypothetical protein PC116_g34881 [Phytophthora cactorum]
MGTSEDVCNLHGHIYFICENNDMEKKAIRVMKESERSIVHGKSPQLWVWGAYPQYLRRDITYPEQPLEVKPNSILEGQLRGNRRS